MVAESLPPAGSSESARPSVEFSITETQEINWNRYEAARWILIVQELRRKYTPEHFYNLELIPRPEVGEEETHLYTSIFVPCEGAIIRNGLEKAFPALLPVDFAEKKTEQSTDKPIVLVRQLDPNSLPEEIPVQADLTDQRELSLTTELYRFMHHDGHFLTASNIAYLLSKEAEPISLVLEKPQIWNFRTMFITHSKSLERFMGIIQLLQEALQKDPQEQEKGGNMYASYSTRKPYHRILWNDKDWTEKGSGKRYGEPGVYIDPEGSLTISVWVNGACYLLQTGMKKLPEDHSSDVFIAKLKALQVNFQADLINAWSNAEEKLKFMQFLKEMKAHFKPDDLRLLMQSAEDSMEIIINTIRSGGVTEEALERMLMEAQMAHANFEDNKRLLTNLIHALQDVQADTVTPVAAPLTHPVTPESIQRDTVE